MMHIYKAILFFFLLAVGSPWLHAVPEERLFVTTIGNSGTLYLNGFPVFSWEDVSAEGDTINLRGNAFMMNGVNRLEIVYTMPGQPVPVDEVPHETSMSVKRMLQLDTDASSDISSEELETVGELVRVRRYDLSGESVFEYVDYIGQETVVSVNGNLREGASQIVINLPAGTASRQTLDTVQGTLGLTFESEISLLDSLPWAGELAALTPDDETEIRTLVSELHSAFMDYRGDLIMGLTPVRTHRIATAFGLNEEAVQAELNGMLNLLQLTSGFNFAPLDSADLDFSIIRGQNLVHVLVGEVDPIRGDSDDFAFSIPVYVSKVEGVWRIVE